MSARLIYRRSASKSGFITLHLPPFREPEVEPEQIELSRLREPQAPATGVVEDSSHPRGHFTILMMATVNGS